MLKPAFAAADKVDEKPYGGDAKLFHEKKPEVVVWVIEDEKDPEGAMCEAAATGDLDKLRKLQYHGLEPVEVGGILVRAAAKHGQLDVLKWLDENNLHPTEGGRWAARSAAERGHLEVLNWLWDMGLNAQFRRGGGIVRGAAQGGQLGVLKWVQEMDLDIQEGGGWAMRLAARGGHLQAVQFLVNEGMALSQHADSVLRGAAKAGAVDILDWVLGQVGMKPVMRNARHCVLAAAEEGNLEVLKWFESRGVRAKIGGGSAVWVATRGGHLEALQWFAEHGLHPSTAGESAVRAAVKGGHLDILAWLASMGLDISSGGSFCGPTTAGEKGHMEVLQWLLAEGAVLQRIAKKVLGGAAKGGRIEVLNWVKENGVAAREYSAYVMVQGAAGGHTAALDWLAKEGVPPESGGWEAVQAAARGGHIGVLEWLGKHGVHLQNHFRAAVIGAASGGHIHILEKLAHDGADLTRYARESVEAAAAKGHQPLLEWLQAEVPPTAGGSSAVRRAATGGHLKTLQWLFDNGLGNEECWLAAVWASKEARQHDVHQWLLDVEGRVRGDVDGNKRRSSGGKGRNSARNSGFSATFSGRNAPKSAKSQKSSVRSSRSANIGEAHGAIVGLHWMMKYTLDPKEGIFDQITRDAADGALETLSWIKQLLGAEWTIRLAVENGNLSILQWLVQDDGLDLKSHTKMAVRLAAEHGHLEMLRWFKSLGMRLDEVALEAAATGGMAMLLDTLGAFELPLANEARMAEEIAPFIHTGRLNATLLANCIMTPSSIAEYVLEMSIREVRKMDKKGRVLSRAIMSSGMTARTYDTEPDCTVLRDTIAPIKRTATQTLFQSGESVPVSVATLVFKAPTSPEVLHALASTERWEVYDTLAAQAIIQAAWHKVSTQYWLDMVLTIVQLLSAVHLTWLFKPSGASNGGQFAAVTPVASLPISFWPMVVVWLKELVFELLQAKAFLYDNSSWRREYMSMTEVWDWLCLMIVGVLIVLMIMGLNDSDTISPVLSFVGFTRWWKVLYSLRGFNYFGQRILPILGAFREILPFLLVVFFYGGAFVHALFALSNDELGSVTLLFFRLGVMADLDTSTGIFGIKDDDSDAPANPEWSGLQIFWFVAGTFLVTTALMNIFIAIMSSAFHTQEQKASANFLRTRASICIGYALCWGTVAGYWNGMCDRIPGGSCLSRILPFALETEEVWMCHTGVASLKTKEVPVPEPAHPPLGKGKEGLSVSQQLVGAMHI